MERTPETRRTWSLRARSTTARLALRSPREKVLAGRKAEMEEMMNHHVFDDIPESEAVGKKLIRASGFELCVF